MIKLSPFQWSSFNFFGFCCAYGVLLPFLPIWLKHYEYDTEMIGVIISLGYIFRFLGAMFFSQKASNPNRLIPINRFLTWATVVIVIVLAWSVHSIWILVPAIAFFHIFNGGAMPIGDTIASTWQQQVNLDYGRSRLFGSMAFVVGSVSTGFLLNYLEESAIIWILLAWLVFLGIGLMLNPTVGFSQSNNNQTQVSNISYWQLFKAPETMKIMIAISLIQASHATYYAYSTIYWSSNGISTQDSSLLWAVGVIAEILFFFVSNKAFKAWKTQHLVILSALGAILRWVIIASTANFMVLIFVQMLHAISYAAGHYAMIRYISSQPVEHIAKLQALYFSISNCILMAIFTFIAGLTYQYSPSISFGLMAIFALPAIFIVPRKLATKF